MSVLASLVRVYETMGDAAPAFGYSSEKIGFEITLNADGSLAGPPQDNREGDGRKRTKRIMVPQPTKRTSGIAPNFLWDKTSYVLGVSAGEGRRTAQEHAAFVTRHKEILRTSNDEGLQALLRFLEYWRPEDFTRFGWPEEMKDQNIAFALKSDTPHCIRIHDRPAARALWGRLRSEGEKKEAACLITGGHGPVARLHPAIKGVWGAQSSGASIVSFNLPAFSSYGHEQGHNAPVSEAVTFAYTTALNWLLKKNGSNRVQIGDASTVFWADASDANSCHKAEKLFAALLGVDGAEENAETEEIAEILEALHQGKPLHELKPKFPQGVRFYILGLSPNASRLSVRFFVEDDFSEIATRYLKHLERMRVVPSARAKRPSMWQLLIEMATQRKSENIPPQLAGEWLRSILTATPYPLTLLTALTTRLRSDQNVNSLRIAIIKSVLIRNFGMEVPVTLDPKNKDPGYLLGRLFATIEYAQRQALGRNISATIRDQYYGIASATPRSVFPLLQRKAMHYLSKLRKESPGLAINLDENRRNLRIIPGRCYVPPA